MRAQDQFRSRFSVICDIDVANPVSFTVYFDFAVRSDYAKSGM